MNPDYSTNAPQASRYGAPMGRPGLESESNIKAALRSAIEQANNADLESESCVAEYKGVWLGRAKRYRQEAKDLQDQFDAFIAANQPPYDPEHHRMTLRRVRLNSGGYDSYGAYFGLGAPLFWCANESGTYDKTFRATDRNAAKAIVRQDLPQARFY